MTYGTEGVTVTEGEAVRAAIEGELRLLDPAVRASRSATLRLLDPEFTEVGASGRRYTYEVMVAELGGHPGSADGGSVYEPSDMTGVLLAPGLVHVTYETRFEGRRARRSSLWRRRDEVTGWRMYYHQGTPVPPEVS
ncbi:DUF4440 domain-containing protein [Streptomyces sp. DSM 41972]|uniref:DUF4440 domain-containing protein n=1 Tax=Streptomyces althioticus subsp. attaecolombicae TaxID=3075534 RepID=A0ABU3I098_9ACTN|nr:DUF4440 domain-containing protein [Streptomyces sp. DSM 41972]SCD70939.1 hypothetical protein GA0115238_12145 [Streptomyces sp. di50b]SCD79172.1 hypothetical protein GA0115245_11355 [Streptomyces sp. di188]